jgi:hypothetical protein
MIPSATQVMNDSLILTVVVMLSICGVSVFMVLANLGLIIFIRRWMRPQ